MPMQPSTLGPGSFSRLSGWFSFQPWLISTQQRKAAVAGCEMYVQAVAVIVVVVVVYVHVQG
jgi:hypothetical protein